MDDDCGRCQLSARTHCTWLSPLTTRASPLPKPLGFSKRRPQRLRRYFGRNSYLYKPENYQNRRKIEISSKPLLPPWRPQTRSPTWNPFRSARPTMPRHRPRYLLKARAARDYSEEFREYPLRHLLPASDARGPPVPHTATEAPYRV